MPDSSRAAAPAARRAVQIVVTPGSGSGRAKATAKWVRRVLVRHGHPTTITSFTDLATLTGWARTCTPDFAYLVCIGGDATLSAAAAASIRCDIPFIPVPNGFGNVFAGVFGHVGRGDAVLKLLRHGEIRRVDVGQVAGGELFLSHRSYGFLERIQQVAERGRRQPRGRLLRHLWYYGVARHAVARTRLASVVVEVDGVRVADDAVLVTVANVETYRGFLTLTPGASPIDGLFDVFVVSRVSKLRLLWRLLGIMLRVPGRWRNVALYRGRSVVVVTSRGREELRTLRRALPLLVMPGAVEAVAVRAMEDVTPASTIAG